jgi:L-threonylcarbamoyladenylate synthase
LTASSEAELEEADMPVLPIENSGAAIEALRSERPVVAPWPSPLPYALTGTRAAAVNLAKKRPAGQPAGLSVADIDVIAPYLDLADDAVPLARWLCESELLSLLVPVSLARAPGWLAPAVQDGLVFFTAAPWLPELATIIGYFGHLYMSSANITSGQPAVTAAEARRVFGDDLIVLDGDARRDPSRPHGSTTIVRMTGAGDLTVARPGINNAAFRADLDAYVCDLSRRWRAPDLEARASGGGRTAVFGRQLERLRQTPHPGSSHYCAGAEQLGPGGPQSPREDQRDAVGEFVAEFRVFRATGAHHIGIEFERPHLRCRDGAERPLVGREEPGPAHKGADAQ